MRNKVIGVSVILFICVVLFAFMQTNFVAKRLGGTINIKLETNQKLVNCSWKDNSLWILTRDMRPEEPAEKYTFKEDSNWSIIEGTVKIQEIKK